MIDILSGETVEKEEGEDKEEIVTYSEIEGKVKTLALTHDGSRVLQRFFQKCSISELDQVLLEIEEGMSVLMRDTYGNYMF